MQIHEITIPKADPVNEVVGGLARMAGEKLAQTKVGQAIGKGIGSIKQAAANTSLGRAISQASDIEKQAAAQAQTDLLGQAMMRQWMNRVAQLKQARQVMGATVSPQDYQANLQDFIEKNMLQKKLTDLETSSRQELGVMIDEIVTNQDDRNQMLQSFKDLAKITTTARAAPKFKKKQKMVQQPQQPVQKTSPQQAQISQQEVAQYLSQGMSRAQQQGLSQFLGGVTVRTTGNPTVDALLNQLGVKTR